jgi:hypothetical protein
MHNRKEIEVCSKEKTLLANIIRDADKIDIFEVIIDHLENGNDNEVLTLHLKNEKDKYSSNLPQKIINNQLIDYNEHIYINDMFLTAIGWGKQLNFKASFQYFREKGYHHRIARYLPGDVHIHEMLNNLDNFLEAACHVSL